VEQQVQADIGVAAQQVLPVTAVETAATGNWNSWMLDGLPSSTPSPDSRSDHMPSRSSYSSSVWTLMACHSSPQDAWSVAEVVEARAARR
jgi:hypothetical protein